MGPGEGGVRVRARDERRDEVDAVGAEVQRAQARRGQRRERQLREQVARQVLQASEPVTPQGLSECYE